MILYKLLGDRSYLRAAQTMKKIVERLNAADSIDPFLYTVLQIAAKLLNDEEKCKYADVAASN